MSDEKEPARV